MQSAAGSERGRFFASALQAGEALWARAGAAAMPAGPIAAFGPARSAG